MHRAALPHPLGPGPSAPWRPRSNGRSQRSPDPPPSRGPRPGSRRPGAPAAPAKAPRDRPSPGRAPRHPAGRSRSVRPARATTRYVVRQCRRPAIPARCAPWQGRRRSVPWRPCSSCGCGPAPEGECVSTRFMPRSPHRNTAVTRREQTTSPCTRPPPRPPRPARRALPDLRRRRRLTWRASEHVGGRGANHGSPGGPAHRRRPSAGAVPHIRPPGEAGPNPACGSLHSARGAARPGPGRGTRAAGLTSVT